MKIKGKVVKDTFGKNTKSEHDAVYLDTNDGKFRLKRKGGNPFHDEVLHDLVGKSVEVEGVITGNFFEVVEILSVD